MSVQCNMGYCYKAITKKNLMDLNNHLKTNSFCCSFRKKQAKIERVS